MKILFLAPDLPPAIGGMQAHAFEIIKRVCQAHDVTVVGGRSAAGLRIARIRPLPLLDGYSIRRRDILAFAGCVKKIKPDILHILGATHAPFAPAAQAVCDVRTVITCHGKDFLNPWTRFPCQGDAAELVGRGIAACDRVITVSRYNREKLTGLGIERKKISVVFNGVDGKIFFPVRPKTIIPGIEPGQPVLLTVARIDERKGFGTVLQALPRVLTKFPSCRYVIVGGVPGVSDSVVWRKLFLPALRTLGIEQKVVYAGSVRDPRRLARYYNACDVFIMVPRVITRRGAVKSVESFGIVYLEANACAKPVIASRTGGISDAVINGVTGITVAPGDIQGTAAAITRLLGDSDLRTRLGAQGLRRVKKEFSWDRIARQTLQIYRSFGHGIQTKDRLC